MPFKTKRRKESAAERRFSWTQNQVVSYESVGQTAPIASHDSASKSKIGETKKITEMLNTSKDLIKIILAASTIVAAQVVLNKLIK